MREYVVELRADCLLGSHRVRVCVGVGVCVGGGNWVKSG